MYRLRPTQTVTTLTCFSHRQWLPLHRVVECPTPEQHCLFAVAFFVMCEGTQPTSMQLGVGGAGAGGCTRVHRVQSAAP